MISYAEITIIGFNIKKFNNNDENTLSDGNLAI